jgi:tRNA G37 N-methylase Trm5
MPSKAEKLRRKQLLNEIIKERTDEFNKSLPMSKEDFQELFDYLDSEFSTKKCDHTNNLTKEYLSKKGTENIENILNWMAGHGGYCDCEILANIEDLFEGGYRNRLL